MYKGQSIDVAVCHIVFIIKSQLTHQFMHKHLFHWYVKFIVWIAQCLTVCHDLIFVVLNFEFNLDKKGYILFFELK